MSIVLLKGSGSSVIQLITVLLLFVFVLFITAWTTKYIGNYQKLQGMNRNLELIEAIRISNNKYLQVVRAGEKYLVIAVGKDEVHMLTELSKEEIILTGSATNDTVTFDSFKSYLNGARDKIRKKGGSSSDNDK